MVFEVFFYWCFLEECFQESHCISFLELGHCLSYKSSMSCSSNCLLASVSNGEIIGVYSFIKKGV